MAEPLAGAPILADDFNAAWTAYTPSYAASAGAAAIGNGTIGGRYKKFGKSVKFGVQFTAGTTTTYGTLGGYWIFGLPPVGNAIQSYAFTARMLDAGTLEYGGIASVASGTATIELFKPVSGRILNNSPFTFGSTDSLWFNGEYEIS